MRNSREKNRIWRFSKNNNVKVVADERRISDGSDVVSDVAR